MSERDKKKGHQRHRGVSLPAQVHGCAAMLERQGLSACMSSETSHFDAEMADDAAQRIVMHARRTGPWAPRARRVWLVRARFAEMHRLQDLGANMHPTTFGVLTFFHHHSLGCILDSDSCLFGCLSATSTPAME